MTYSDGVGWSKSVVTFAAGFAGMGAYHARSLDHRILWIVMGLGFALIAGRLIDRMFEGRIAQERRLGKLADAEGNPTG